MCYVLNSCTWRYLFIGHGQPKKVVYFVWFARCHARDVYAEELRYRGYLWTDFSLNRFKLQKRILNPAKHPEADSEPSRTTKMDLFPFVKSSILDLRLGSENTSVIYMKLFMEVLTVNSFVTEVSIFFFLSGLYHVETSPLIYRTNQWTGFCVIGTPVMKELTRLVKKVRSKMLYKFINTPLH